jgi:protein-disulfide isomerase
MDVTRLAAACFALQLATVTPRVGVDASAGHGLGPSVAPVTIVVFADFACPYCARLAPTLRALQTAYDNQVRLVFREFPLGDHPRAAAAAAAAECAADQGRFWQMHDRLFADQRHLEAGDLLRRAREIGLDTEEFERCRVSGHMRRRIEKDLADGARYGVAGTPTLFVNGRYVSGLRSFESLAALVDEELAREASQARSR